MTRRHPLLLPILALLLTTRALVPTGWMPAVDKGGVHIMLCTGQGLVGARLGADGKLHRDDPGDGKHHDPCPYSTLAHAVDSPALPEVVKAPEQPPEQYLAQLLRELIAPLHAPRPPTRGPPPLA